MRSNCLVVALYILVKRGFVGSIDYRKSRNGWFPHFFYKEKHHLINYVPIEPEHRQCPPIVFKGKLKWGDK